MTCDTRLILAHNRYPINMPRRKKIFHKGSRSETLWWAGRSRWTEKWSAGHEEDGCPDSSRWCQRTFIMKVLWWWSEGNVVEWIQANDTVIWYWSMMCLFNFLPTLSFIYMYIRQVTQPGDVPMVTCLWSGRRLYQKSPGLDLLKNVNHSGLRKLSINSNSVSSAWKRPGRLCQTPGPCRAAGSHFRVFSKYPQDIISRLSFVSVHSEASLQCCINRRNFHSSQTQLTPRRILPFRLSVGDMINDDSGEYLTGPYKRNRFAEIRVASTLNLKITQWDLRYNAYQHPCDSLVKPFEWQPKKQRKMQHWGKCL